MIRNIVFRITKEEKKMVDEFCDFLAGIEFQLNMALKENIIFLTDRQCNSLEEKIANIEIAQIDIHRIIQMIEE